MKIVFDSSADIRTVENVESACAPLKIITAQQEYVDNAQLDIAAMVEDLAHYKGKSSTSCPNPEDWLQAFGDAKEIFCVTITGTLSGSYNAACLAKKQYEETHPGSQILVINSLSTGPEMKLIIEKLQELILSGMDFDAIAKEITQYTSHTGLLFMLESMRNLANNGRVSSLVAKAAGLLGIRVVGKASAKGDLEPLDKCRGESSALNAIVTRMLELGYAGGRMRIAHCFNETAARKLLDLIKTRFENVCAQIYATGGLCSFYAERGGLLIGFEKG